MIWKNLRSMEVSAYLGVVQHTFSRKLSLRRPWANLARILREHSKTTCSIQISFSFTCFRGCVCVCKPLPQAESLQTTGQGASDPFLDLPRVCLFAALQLPFFQTLCRNSWLKEVDMASSVLHTFGRARILREPCVDFDPVLATFRSIWLKHYEAVMALRRPCANLARCRF